jgi:hypothetical protein
MLSQKKGVPGGKTLVRFYPVSSLGMNNKKGWGGEKNRFLLSQQGICSLLTHNRKKTTRVRPKKPENSTNGWTSKWVRPKKSENSTNGRTSKWVRRKRMVSSLRRWHNYRGEVN